MQKAVTKILILAVVLTAALGVNYLFASWVGPTQAPTGGNTSTPVHVGTTDQVKDGGLSLDGLSVFGGGYFQGNVGIGVVTPSQDLEVAGQIKIGKDDSISPAGGTIRWTGSDFEGYDGTQWVSLVSGEAVAVVDPDYIECTDAGGGWVAGQGACYFSGTSCPSGWSKKSIYSSTSGATCTTCSVGSHTRAAVSIESCNYNFYTGETCLYRPQGCRTGCACQISKPTYSSGICYAIQTEVGCTKN